MKHFFLLITSFTLFLSATANNVTISNVSIVNNGPSNIQVQFDISWDNSWNTNIGTANHDGVWVFFRYRSFDSLWKSMSLTGLNNIVPAGADIYQTSETFKTGAMIYREAGNYGTGNVSFTGIRLGVIGTLPYDIDIKAFAIEMVYIPAVGNARPSFGDGNGTSESQNAFHYADNTATNNGIPVTKADANIYDDAELTADGIWIYSNDSIQTSNPIGSLDPFPTMKAIWCMKYEISQAAYRDFLNSLTLAQQAGRTASSPSSSTSTPALAAPANLYRNYIKIKAPSINGEPAVYGCDANANGVFDEAADGEWIACNYMLWQDVAAFLDWSGLAPMTEIQYERICRGHTSAGGQPAVYGEYAWGTNSIYSSGYVLSNPNTAAETIMNGTGTAGNAVWGAVYPAAPNSGPFRSGIFATAVSNRISSGSSFFGVMDMTGGVNEFCISIGTVAGRSARVVANGNGTISLNGNAQVNTGAGFWPGVEGNNTASIANTCNGNCEVTGVAGIMMRGGNWSTTPAAALAVSYRSSLQPSASARSATCGGRGVLYPK